MKKTLLLMLGAIWLLTACGSANSGGDNDFLALSDLPSEESVEKEEYFEGSEDDFRNQTEFKVPDPSDRMLIRTADLQFEVEDLGKTAVRITDITKAHRGYISSDSESRNSYRLSRSMTLRVPVDQFDATLAAISEGVTHFDRRRIDASDVTAEFRDNEARLRAKKALEARYLELLNKAKNVAEMLEIERELGEIREEIESVEGRQKYLSDQVSMSTIEVEYYEEIEDTRPESGFGSKIGRALENGLDGLGIFFLVILNLWPLWVFLIGLLFFIRWIVRRRKAHKED